MEAAHDPYPAALQALRAGVMSALSDLGLSPSDRGKMVMLPGVSEDMRRRDVWSFQSRRLVVPTVEVLNTNVRRESKLPRGLHVESDFKELWELLDTTLESFREVPLFGYDEKGVRFDLKPAQLAAIMIASRGSVSSSMEMSVTLQTLAAAGVVADHSFVPLSRSLQGATHREMLPSFNWFAATTGSGKTIMSLTAALLNVTRDWDACKREFSFWSRSGRAIDPFIQLGTNDTGKRLVLKRAVLVVADSTTRLQWLANMRANLPFWQKVAPVGAKVVIWPSKGDSLGKDESFEDLQAVDDDTIVFMLVNYLATGPKSSALKKRKLDQKNGAAQVEYSGTDFLPALDVFLKHYAHVAIVAGVFDEFARNGMALSCPFGRPEIYRTYGVTATPSTIVSSVLHKSTRTTNLAKLILCSDSSKLKDSSDMTSMRVNGSHKERAHVIDFATRFVSTDALCGLRGLIAREAASLMPPAVEVFNVRIEAVSLAVLLSCQRHDMVPMQFSALVANVTSDSGQRFAAGGTPFFTPSDITDILDRTIDITPQQISALDWRATAERNRAVERRRKIITLFSGAAKCSTCLCALDSKSAKIAACCSGIFCNLHADPQRCAFCGTENTEALSEAEKAEPPETGDTYDWFLDAMRGIQDDRTVSFFAALERSLRAATLAGNSCFLVFASMWTDGGGMSAAEKATQLALYTNVLKGACQSANVMTMFRADGVLKNPSARNGVISTFKNSTGVRFLMLHDAEGKDEQITGLDLHETDCIVSIGAMVNPHQAYPRGLRSRPNPRQKNLPIIRIGPDISFSG